MTRSSRLLAFVPFTLGAALLVLACTSASAAGTVGEKGTPFKLTGVDGKQYSLDDFKGKTVVLEWINPNCPFSDRHAREKTMIHLAAKHDEVVWLAINSTNPESPDYLPPEKHRKWMEERGVAYPVLYDPTGATGHAYGAKTTPHMFILGEDGTILYNGAIDDDPRGQKAQADRLNYVDQGLDARAVGRTIAPSTTRPYGCSVKY